MEAKRTAKRGPGFWTGLRSLLAGLGYLFLVAVVFSGMTEVPVFLVFLAVLAGAAFSTLLALWWLTRWALREDIRKGQFGLGSLLFLTTFVALYFGVVRWLVVNLRPLKSGRPTQGLELFLMVGVLCILLAAVAVPLLLGMAESLVWLAVWIVRRRTVRRWLAGRRPPRRDE